MQKWSFVYYFNKKRSDGFIRHLQWTRQTKPNTNIITSHLYDSDKILFNKILISFEKHFERLDEMMP